MMNFGLSERFFLFGIKKAVFGSEYHLKRFNILIKHYPYIDRTLFPPLENSYIFFQDQETKERIYKEFLEPNKHLKKFSPEFDRIIGTILGFPPKAVEFYSSRESQRHPEKRIYLRFCGVECVGSVDDMVDDVKWLWDTYPYPDADVLCIEYEKEYIEFEFGDLKSIEAAQKGLKNYIATKQKTGT